MKRSQLLHQGLTSGEEGFHAQRQMWPFGDQFARLYNVVSLPAYFALLGVVSVAAGVALLLVVRPMLRLMSGVR